MQSFHEFLLQAAVEERQAQARQGEFSSESGQESEDVGGGGGELSTFHISPAYESVESFSMLRAASRSGAGSVSDSGSDSDSDSAACLPAWLLSKSKLCMRL